MSACYLQILIDAPGLSWTCRTIPFPPLRGPSVWILCYSHSAHCQDSATEQFGSPLHFLSPAYSSFPNNRGPADPLRDPCAYRIRAVSLAGIPLYVALFQLLSHTLSWRAVEHSSLTLSSPNAPFRSLSATPLLSQVSCEKHSILTAPAGHSNSHKIQVRVLLSPGEAGWSQDIQLLSPASI